MAKLSQHNWCTVVEGPQVLQQVLTVLDSGYGVDAHFVHKAKDAFPNQWGLAPAKDVAHLASQQLLSEEAHAAATLLSCVRLTPVPML
ncbi:hypothetical protein WJX77_000878 [Trebouxia sp. C0004]